MPNGVQDFEEYILPRLEATRDSEGSAYVLGEWKTTWEGNLVEAMLDAIEHLPARKTKLLRDWVAQAPNFSDWKALERRGWVMDTLWPAGTLPRKGDKFAVFLPKDTDEPAAWDYDAIAAGAGASDVNYTGPNKRIWPGHVAHVFTVASVL